MTPREVTPEKIRGQDKRWVVVDRKALGDAIWIQVAPALYAQKPGPPRIGREIAYAEPLEAPKREIPK